MNLITRTLATLAASLICFCSLSFAASIPTTLSYQGALNDKGGTPVTASKTLVFSLYNVATEGTAFWTENQSLNVVNGRFGAVLGVVTPMDISKFGGDT